MTKEQSKLNISPVDEKLVALINRLELVNNYIESVEFNQTILEKNSSDYNELATYLYLQLIRDRGLRSIKNIIFEIREELDHVLDRMENVDQVYEK